MRVAFKMTSETIKYGMLATLLVYRNTPAAALHRETGILPVQILLEEIRPRKAL